jgi:hypothetical protein
MEILESISWVVEGFVGFVPTLRVLEIYDRKKEISKSTDAQCSAACKREFEKNSAKRLLSYQICAREKYGSLLSISFITIEIPLTSLPFPIDGRPSTKVFSIHSACLELYHIITSITIVLSGPSKEHTQSIVSFYLSD